MEKYRGQPELLAQYDGVFNFSWTMSDIKLSARAKRSTALVTCGGLLYDRQREGDWRSKVVTASRTSRRAKERLPQFDGVVAVNREGYEAAKKYTDKAVLIPSGINMDFYTPGPAQPVNPGKLTIGWCGQRRCNVKGLKEIVKPLRERLSGPEFVWQVNDRDFGEALSREEMVKWYHGIDVLISTSIIEGTPSPVFEAAACGRCVLSTRVGMVADWGAAAECNCVAPAYANAAEAEQTIGWFERRLSQLAHHPDDVQRLGEGLRASLVGWCDYPTVAPKYLKFIAGD